MERKSDIKLNQQGPPVGDSTCHRVLLKFKGVIVKLKICAHWNKSALKETSSTNAVLN